MFFLRLALYTCCFYLAIAVLLETAVFAVTWKAGFGIYFAGRGAIAAFAGFWGLVWLLSFLLAFRLVFGNIWARFLGWGMVCGGKQDMRGAVAAIIDP